MLGLYVREKKVLSLEEAVRKMTSLPATHFRLGGRGLVKEGYAVIDGGAPMAKAAGQVLRPTPR